MSHPQPLEPDDRPESSMLDWQAWCYVSGEMPASEVTAFEARLVDDLSACEAVAWAVDLNDALAAVGMPIAQHSGAAQHERAAVDRMPGRGTSPRRRAPWLRRLGWTVAGAAACLAIVLAVRWQDTQDVAIDEPGSGDPAARLAQAWTELLDSDVTDDANRESSAERESFGESLAYVEPAELGMTSTDDSVAPDWLLAALIDVSSEEETPAEPAPNPPNQTTPN